MKSLSVTEVVRNCSVVLDGVEREEIRFGIDLMADPKHKAMAMLRPMRRKPLLRIGAETAEVFGALAARLAKSGRGHEFRIQDHRLASQAIERKFTRLTANARDFGDMPGVKFLAVGGV